MSALPKINSSINNVPNTNRSTEQPKEQKCPDDRLTDCDAKPCDIDERSREKVAANCFTIPFANPARFGERLYPCIAIFNPNATRARPCARAASNLTSSVLFIFHSLTTSRILKLFCERADTVNQIVTQKASTLLWLCKDVR